MANTGTWLAPHGRNSRFESQLLGDLGVTQCASMAWFEVHCPLSISDYWSFLLSDAPPLMLMWVKSTSQTSASTFERRLRRSATSVRMLVKSSNARFLRPSPTSWCRRRRSTMCDHRQLWSTMVDGVSMNTTEIYQYLIPSCPLRLNAVDSVRMSSTTSDGVQNATQI